MEHPAQVVLTVSQIFWCRDVDNCLRSLDPIHSLELYRDICVERLEKLAGEHDLLLRFFLFHIH